MEGRASGTPPRLPPTTVLKLERLDVNAYPWERFDAFPDRTVFQTRAWLEYVAETQRAEPVLCVVEDGNSIVGSFSGLLVRRLGFRILGSPLPGWGTGYLGFNLEHGVSRREAADALRAFAARDLRCAHLELRDRYLEHGELDGLGFAAERFRSFEIDLLRDEDEIFAGMSSACRRCIRKAEKVGVTIEEADDLGFADEYYAQLEDVFAKQSLRPTYGLDRVRALVTHLRGSGRVLFLRARAPDGRCIATGIFPALGRMMYFWGGASLRADQIHRPNEAVFWYAMRYWKAHGGAVLDMGGGGEYKRKYGGVEISVPHFRHSRLPGVGAARTIVRRLHGPRRLRTAGETASGATTEPGQASDD